MYPTEEKKKALIAMSGGVDSSVSALLMKKAGYDCIGVTMKLYGNEEIGAGRVNTCCSLADTDDARSVAFKIGIPYYVFNFKDDFEDKVIRRFIDSYEKGSTPNPCIDCNRFMKFEKLYKRAKELDYTYIATGHYARIEKNTDTGRYMLKKGLDDTKDQSYVLYTLTQDQLAHTVFPLGGLRKTEVRKIAEENGFKNAGKRDSQDICFVPDGNYAEFIEHYTKKHYECGEFIDMEGKMLGRHKGIIRYTIGQRKGLGIAFGKPMYVCSKCQDMNTVTLGDISALYTKELAAKDINMIAVEKLTGPVKLKVRIRYTQKEQAAIVTQTGDDTLKIIFDEPLKAACRGQAVVLYDDDIVVGGGTIV